MEHTTDGFSSSLAYDLTDALGAVAGSSPSRDVCWLVGANGLVLVTTSAKTGWQKLPFPESVTLVSVAAADAVSATVRTADGREFSTKDAGKTWILRSVQDF